MKIKKCNKCKEIKSIEDFHKVKGGKYGVRGYCKECTRKQNKKYWKNNKERLKKRHREQQREYYKKNIKKIKEYKREYYKNNVEKIKERVSIWAKNNTEKIRKAKAIWIKNNPEKIKEINKRKYGRRKLNSTIYLSSIISRSINHSLKNGKTDYHWESLVNYTLQDLIIHLESLFKPGMSWSNYGKDGWEIDHKKPISSFNFSSYEDKEFKKCWDLNNLQPLWAEENIRKGKK